MAKVSLAVYLGVVLLFLGWWGTLAYVVLHFIAKFW